MIWFFVVTMSSVDPTVLASAPGLTSVNVTITTEFNSEQACKVANDTTASQPAPYGYTVSVGSCEVKK